jgi:hypothetical protein
LCQAITRRKERRGRQIITDGDTGYYISNDGRITDDDTALFRSGEGGFIGFIEQVPGKEREKYYKVPHFVTTTECFSNGQWL